MTKGKFLWATTALVALLAVVGPTVDFAAAQPSPATAQDSSKAKADDDDADDVGDVEDDDDADKDDVDKDDADKDDDDADKDDADKDDAADDDGQALASRAKLTVEQAKAAALAAAPGSVIEEVDLEMHDGVLVYEVEMIDKKVRIDATTGAVASIKPRKPDRD